MDENIYTGPVLHKEDVAEAVGFYRQVWRELEENRGER